MINKVAILSLILLAPLHGANSSASCSSSKALIADCSSKLSDSVSAEQPGYLRFESGEGHVFVIAEDVAKQSGTIAAMLAPEVRQMVLESDQPIQFNELGSAPMGAVFRLMQLVHGGKSAAGVKKTLEGMLLSDKNERLLLQDLIEACSFLCVNGSIRGALVAAVSEHGGLRGIKNKARLPYVLVESYMKNDIKQALQGHDLVLWSQKVLQGHKNSVLLSVFSPDCARVASASSDQTVRIWDTKSGECLHVLKGHRGCVRSAVFSPSSKRVASASDDQAVRIWDTKSGECLHVLEGHEGSVNFVIFSPDGTTIASASDDEAVRIWDAESGKCLHVLEGHVGWINSVTLSPDGTKIVSASDDQAMRIWDTRSGECLHVLEGHEGSVNFVMFSPDGTKIASASDDEAVRIWDAESGECLHVLKGHEDYVKSVIWSPDSTAIVSASDDKTVRIWDAESGKSLHVLKGHQGWVRSVVFSPDGTKIASASEDREMHIWDAGSGKCLHILKGHQDWVKSVVFSSDGTKIASASSDWTVRLWENLVDGCREEGVRLLHKASAKWREQKPYLLSSDVEKKVHQRLPKELQSEKLFEVATELG